jgi:hypothetical protein
MTICICYLVLEMVDDRRVMYDGFSKKSGHLAEWVRIVKEFLNKAFLMVVVLQSAPAQFVETIGF